MRIWNWIFFSLHKTLVVGQVSSSICQQQSNRAKDRLDLYANVNDISGQVTKGVCHFLTKYYRLLQLVAAISQNDGLTIVLLTKVITQHCALPSLNIWEPMFYMGGFVDWL